MPPPERVTKSNRLQFVQFKESFGKQQGETVNWLKVANVSTYGGKLVETATMHETPQVLTWGTLSVDEYGMLIAAYTFRNFMKKFMARFTKKLEACQEKSGEFRETPNVKPRAILSQAIEGIGSMEGATTRLVSPNNNPVHERPTRKGKDSLSCMETCRTMA